MIALAIFVLFLVPSLASAQMLSRQPHAGIFTGLNKTNSLAYIEPGSTQQSRLYADGSVIDLQTASITWPILQNEKVDLTQDQFKAMVKSAKNNFDNDPNKIIISKGDPRGLDIQFVVTSPPSGAQAAINAVAAYIESLFSDPVTVVITLGFESMSPGILGIQRATMLHLSLGPIPEQASSLVWILMTPSRAIFPREAPSLFATMATAVQSPMKTDVTSQKLTIVQQSAVSPVMQLI